MDRERISFFLDSAKLRNYEPLSIQRVTTDILCGDFDAQLDLIIAAVARRKHVLSIAPKPRRIMFRRSIVLKKAARKAPGFEAGKKPAGTEQAGSSNRAFSNT